VGYGLWNPIAAYDRETGKRGWFCTKVSPGCTNCYAEQWNRFRGNGHLYRVGNLDKVRFELSPTLTAPLRWRKQRRVFVNSMTDLFLEQHTDEMIDQVIGVIAALRAWCMPHEFLVLTKRPERARDYFASTDTQARVARIAAQNTDDANADRAWDNLMFHWWPLSNLWLGVSVENQEAADERIPLLLDTPAAIRFLSCEPLLGPVDLCKRVWLDVYGGIDWVIVGGESGSDARPCDVQWIRNIVEQCHHASLPVFVKQLGAEPGFTVEDEERRGNGMPSFHHYDKKAGLYIKAMDDAKGGDPKEWPTELRVRQYPGEVATV
jgi:protein gp37